MSPEIDVIEIVNPWGSRDELVLYSWREDAVTGLADVTTRGRRSFQSLLDSVPVAPN